MLRHRAVRVVPALSALLFLAAGASVASAQEIVYENYSTPAGTFALLSPGQTEPPLYREVGDVVTLGGANRVLTSLNFTYSNNSDPAANSLIDFAFNIYNVDGSNMPVGDPIYSAPFSQSFTGTVSNGFTRTLTLDDEFVMPETFAWTFGFTNRRDNPDTANDGLQTTFSYWSSTPPPTVGSTPDGFLRRRADTGVFETTSFTSGRQPRLRLFAQPIPEPTGLSLLAAAGLVALRRRRA